MGTSGLMSGEGKRVGYLSVPITRPSSTLPDRNFLRQRVEHRTKNEASASKDLRQEATISELGKRNFSADVVITANGCN
jgi:hypothetical protein